jgi:hypothetical protein
MLMFCGLNLYNSVVPYESGASLYAADLNSGWFGVQKIKRFHVGLLFSECSDGYHNVFMQIKR